MHPYQIIAAAAALFVLSAPAFAQIYTQPAQQYNQPSRTLGSSDAAPRWTAQDIAAMCEARWPGQPNSSRDCIARNQSKVGRNQTPADMQQLNLNRKPAPVAPQPMQQPAPQPHVRNIP